MKKDDFKEYAIASLRAVVIVLGVLMVIWALMGCGTTKYITVPEVHTDTVRITKVQRDSIYLKDSTHVSEKQKGDTLLIEIERWHTKYQDVLRIDTAYISRRDSIPVPYPVEKRVPAELNWFQQARIWLGNLVLLALAIFIGWRVIKYYFRVRVNL